MWSYQLPFFLDAQAVGKRGRAPRHHRSAAPEFYPEEDGPEPAVPSAGPVYIILYSLYIYFLSYGGIMTTDANAPPKQHRPLILSHLRDDLAGNRRIDAGGAALPCRVAELAERAHSSPARQPRRVRRLLCAHEANK